jgi:hypothetical protein
MNYFAGTLKEMVSMGQSLLKFDKYFKFSL